MSIHWVKIEVHTKKTKIKLDELFLENISTDFIKGMYCAMYDPLDDDKIDTDDDIIVSMTSEFTLKKCVFSDILVAWDKGNNFEYFYQSRLDYCNRDNHETRRKKILNNPKNYNKCLEEFIKTCPNDHGGLHTLPTKRFFAFIWMRYSNLECVIQFDSIDFLNGLEMMHAWMDDNLLSRWQHHSSYKKSIYLKSIFDTFKVCRATITYQHPHERNKLLYIFDHVNKYLLKELTQIIIYDYINQQCNNYNANNNSVYDECLTYSIEPSCHIHRRPQVSRQLRLINCVAHVQLEQL